MWNSNFNLGKHKESVCPFLRCVERSDMVSWTCRLRRSSYSIVKFRSNDMNILYSFRIREVEAIVNGSERRSSSSKYSFGLLYQFLCILKDLLCNSSDPSPASRFVPITAKIRAVEEKNNLRRGFAMFRRNMCYVIARPRIRKEPKERV